MKRLRHKLPVAYRSLPSSPALSHSSGSSGNGTEPGFSRSSSPVSQTASDSCLVSRGLRSASSDLSPLRRQGLPFSAAVGLASSFGQYKRQNTQEFKASETDDLCALLAGIEDVEFVCTPQHPAPEPGQFSNAVLEDIINMDSDDDLEIPPDKGDQLGGGPARGQPGDQGSGDAMANGSSGEQGLEVVMQRQGDLVEKSYTGGMEVQSVEQAVSSSTTGFESGEMEPSVSAMGSGDAVPAAASEMEMEADTPGDPSQSDAGVAEEITTDVTLESLDTIESANNQTVVPDPCTSSQTPMESDMDPMGGEDYSVAQAGVPLSSSGEEWQTGPGGNAMESGSHPPIEEDSRGSGGAVEEEYSVESSSQYETTTEPSGTEVVCEVGETVGDRGTSSDIGRQSVGGQQVVEEESDAKIDPAIEEESHREASIVTTTVESGLAEDSGLEAQSVYTTTAGKQSFQYGNAVHMTAYNTEAGSAGGDTSVSQDAGAESYDEPAAASSPQEVTESLASSSTLQSVSSMDQSLQMAAHVLSTMPLYAAEMAHQTSDRRSVVENTKKYAESSAQYAEEAMETSVVEQEKVPTVADQFSEFAPSTSTEQFAGGANEQYAGVDTESDNAQVYSDVSQSGIRQYEGVADNSVEVVQEGGVSVAGVVEAVAEVEQEVSSSGVDSTSDLAGHPGIGESVYNENLDNLQGGEAAQSECQEVLQSDEHAQADGYQMADSDEHVPTGYRLVQPGESGQAYQYVQAGEHVQAEGYQTVESGEHVQAEGYEVVQPGEPFQAEGYQAAHSGEYLQAEEYQMAESSQPAQPEYQVIQSDEHLQSGEYQRVQHVPAEQQEVESGEHTQAEEYQVTQPDQVQLEEYQVAQANQVVSEEYQVSQGDHVSSEEYQVSQGDHVSSEEYQVTQGDQVSEEYQVTQADQVSEDYQVTQADQVSEEYQVTQADQVSEEYQVTQADQVSEEYQVTGADQVLEEYQVTQVDQVSAEYQVDQVSAEYQVAQEDQMQSEEYQATQEDQVQSEEYQIAQADQVQSEEYQVAQADEVQSEEYQVAQADEVQEESVESFQPMEYISAAGAPGQNEQEVGQFVVSSEQPGTQFLQETLERAPAHYEQQVVASEEFQVVGEQSSVSQETGEMQQVTSNEFQVVGEQVCVAQETREVQQVGTSEEAMDETSMEVDTTSAHADMLAAASEIAGVTPSETGAEGMEIASQETEAGSDSENEEFVPVAIETRRVPAVEAEKEAEVVSGKMEQLGVGETSHGQVALVTSQSQVVHTIPASVAAQLQQISSSQQVISGTAVAALLQRHMAQQQSATTVLQPQQTSLLQPQQATSLLQPAPQTVSSLLQQTSASAVLQGTSLLKPANVIQAMQSTSAQQAATSTQQTPQQVAGAQLPDAPLTRILQEVPAKATGPQVVNLYVQWQNVDALCWLDVLLCPLVHSPTLTALMTPQRMQDIEGTILSTLLNAYRQAQGVLEALLTRASQQEAQARNDNPVQQSSTTPVVSIVNKVSYLPTCTVGASGTPNLGPPFFQDHFFWNPSCCICMGLCSASAFCSPFRVNLRGRCHCVLRSCR